MKILKTILSHRTEKLPVFDSQRVVLSHGFDVISNSICSLNCQYAQPMHIIGKVSQSDFDISSDYSNCPYYLKSWLFEPVLRKHVLFAIEF